MHKQAILPYYCCKVFYCSDTFIILSVFSHVNGCCALCFSHSYCQIVMFQLSKYQICQTSWIMFAEAPMRWIISPVHDCSQNFICYFVAKPHKLQCKCIRWQLLNKWTFISLKSPAYITSTLHCTVPRPDKWLEKIQFITLLHGWPSRIHSSSLLIL